MATLKYSFSLMNFFPSSSLILFILFAFLLNKSYAFEAKKDDKIESHFQTLEISSLLPASVCSPSTNTGSNKRQSTLEVIHRHGPCSRLGHDEAATATATPTLSEVLSYDQSRVESIQARLNPSSNTDKLKETSNSEADGLKDRKANLPVQSGQSLGSDNYIVSVGLGTPKKTLSLVFDTGSDLTWTQCQPCARSCYKQQDPIFNPSSSSSYSNVSCNSPQCSQLSTATSYPPGCASTTCVYGVQYGDRSFTVGFLGTDKLTISATDVFPKFLFGCGQNNQGLFGNTAGLLGLGRDPISFVSQTAKKYGRYFSYCLPSTPSFTGHLTLGKTTVPRNVKYTPFARGQISSFYFIDILEISVGGHKLPISQTVFKTAGSIIDSGTVITRLPPKAYSALRTAFKKLMTKYPSAPANLILDTCYNLSGYTTINIPTISFTFSGNTKVELPSSGILIDAGASIVCLAVGANNNDNDLAIFGNTQQKTFEVVYDVAGGKLGFGPAGCK